MGRTQRIERIIGSTVVMRRRQRRRLARTLGVTVLVGVLVLVGLVVSDAWSTGGHPARAESPVRQRSSEAKVVPSTTTTQLSSPYPVQTSTVSLFDPTRNTPARGSVPASSGRVLTTDVWRPVGPTGPLPLVVFAHGWDSDPDVYATLLSTWAAAGFLVAAPVFPDSADTLPGTPVSDYPDQALDMSFVITAFLGGVAGPVDPNRIAVAGHSDGGTDVALLALNPTFADHRIKAYLSLSSEIPDGVAGPWGAPTPGALLVAVGTDDEYGLLPQSTQVYQTADMVKAMLTVSGGDHLQTFIANTPQSEAVREETVRFLQLALDPGTVTPTTLGAVLTPPPDPSIAVAVGSGSGSG